MMKIVWLPHAMHDMAKILEYYTEVASQSVANRQLVKISKSVRLLESQPYIEHISADDPDDDVLEWHIPNTTYTLPYMIIADEIRIMRVFDERQERPDSRH